MCDTSDIIRYAVGRAIDDGSLEAFEWLKAWWHGETSLNDDFEGEWHLQISEEKLP